MLRFLCTSNDEEKIKGDALMNWNGEPIPYAIALRIGWNLPIDVVGAGVYGGICKRDAKGNLVIGDEWPENNRTPPAHNPVHSKGPYLDFSKYTSSNRGYTAIAQLISARDQNGLKALFKACSSDAERAQLANLVMTGGARPLHMCGMSRGGDSAAMIKILLQHGAEPNALDNYELTPLDRLHSNSVSGDSMLRSAGGVNARQLRRKVVPKWHDAKFAYNGPGDADLKAKKECGDEQKEEVPPAGSLVVSGAPLEEVNGAFQPREISQIPKGFAKVCVQQGWDTKATWQRLADPSLPWYELPNGAYLYFNVGDRKWWLDEPSGHGVFTLHVPRGKAAWPIPASAQWTSLRRGVRNPTISVQEVKFK